MARTPTLRAERALLREGHLLVAGVDEVGRGALAGPVSVGVAVVDASTRTAPAGLRDSKLLAPEAREDLAPRLRRWAVAHAVGHASAGEVDALGIVRALRLAGRRALEALDAVPCVVLLDGSHDWLSTPRPRGAGRTDPWVVRTQVKADLRCAAVAAASVLAKTERDGLLRDLAARDDRYGWAGNKGYSAPDHLAALRRHGACVQHRRSWRLPGLEEPAAAPSAGAAPAGVPQQATGREPEQALSGRMADHEPVVVPVLSARKGP
ncbi:ribonuclease HII [uncultured Pseudokineococcus sp.]|uniref:ribonuclease HII n=1 Tax=uncultured Pseudokineococcus sp. TaxID=1642928 RepID=UPI0034396757